MSDLEKIKEKLRLEEKIEKLLEHIGCEYIKSEQRGKLISAQLPTKFYSDNRRAVQVRLNEVLSCYIRNRSDFKGDIFNLVSYIYFDKRGEDIQKNLYKSKEFICKLFGWNQFIGGNNDSVVVKDYTASLRNIIGGKEKKIEIKSNPVLSDNIMDSYYYFNKPLPYKSWIDEGISYKTQVYYGVGFCLESKRVVFPIRNRFGKIVGVKGRIMKDEDDDRKYIYLHRCNNSYEWFNFHIAHPHILSEKCVFIFESEKSCMIAYSNDIYNTLAIGASDISMQQAHIIKQLGTDIKIVLCYDKDKTVDEIKSQAEKFKGRKIYGMLDTENLLEDKDSPIDKGMDKWNYLVENNIFAINFE